MERAISKFQKSCVHHSKKIKTGESGISKTYSGITTKSLEHWATNRWLLVESSTKGWKIPTGTILQHILVFVGASSIWGHVTWYSSSLNPANQLLIAYPSLYKISSIPALSPGTVQTCMKSIWHDSRILASQWQTIYAGHHEIHIESWSLCSKVACTKQSATMTFQIKRKFPPGWMILQVLPPDVLVNPIKLAASWYEDRRMNNKVPESHCAIPCSKNKCSTSFPTRILTTSWMTITVNWIDVWLPLKFSPFQWHLAVKMSGYFFLKLLGSGKETLGRPRPLNISMLLFDQFHPSIFSSCLLFETTSWGW